MDPNPIPGWEPVLRSSSGADLMCDGEGLRSNLDLLSLIGPAPPVSDLAPGQSGMDDMKLLEQRAEQLAAEAERDQPPRAQSKIFFVR